MQPSVAGGVDTIRSKPSVRLRMAPRASSAPGTSRVDPPRSPPDRANAATRAAIHPGAADHSPAIAASSWSSESRMSCRQSCWLVSSIQRSNPILRTAIPASAVRLAAGSVTPRRRSVSAKCRKNVRSVGPARFAICATVVWSNPVCHQASRAARTRSLSSSSGMAAASSGRSWRVPLLVFSPGWREVKASSRPCCQP